MSKLSRELRVLNNKVPGVKCIKGCTDCCGPVMFNQEEMNRLKENNLLITESNKSLDCVYLKNGGCSIYEYRPMVCRMYGADKNLQCQKIPDEAKLSAEKGSKIFAKYMKVSAGENGEQPMFTATGEQIDDVPNYVIGMMSHLLMKGMGNG